MRRITDQQKQEMCELYFSGQAKDYEIAEAYNCYYPDLQRYLKSIWLTLSWEYIQQKYITKGRS